MASVFIAQTTYQNPKTKCILAIGLTIATLFFVCCSLLIIMLLVPLWYLLFRPWKMRDGIMFGFASLFFLSQNYFVLKNGGFFFDQQDILLMPYYEPFLWGFYYITLKRFIADPREGSVELGWKAILGLAATGLCFSLFASESNLLLISTLISTSLLLILFHEKYDLYYALCAMVLGFAVEVFGVSTGLWWYPEPDFWGIPYWFATMWISVGILGRRFLIPLSYRLSKLLS